MQKVLDNTFLLYYNKAKSEGLHRDDEKDFDGDCTFIPAGNEPGPGN